MTADERIEKLLNRFGQTISDLPKASEEKGHAYDCAHRISANTAAREWGHMARPMSDDYICHLCDVIDRMEAALETAARWGDCFVCSGFGRDCMADNPCEKFEMSDAYLS